MRLWVNVFGGPAVCAVIGFALFLSVEYLHFGTSLEMYRVKVLYASQIAFGLGLMWTLRNLWMVIKAYRGQGQSCFECGFPVTQKFGKYGTYSACWGCVSNRPRQP